MTTTPPDMPGQPDDDAAAGTSQAGTGNPASVGVPASAWSNLDAVDLAAEFGTPVPTMQSVPVFLRHGVRLALRALREAYARGTAPQQTRAWKLFLLLPRLLLHRAREPGNVQRTSGATGTRRPRRTMGCPAHCHARGRWPSLTT